MPSAGPPPPAWRPPAQGRRAARRRQLRLRRLGLALVVLVVVIVAATQIAGGDPAPAIPRYALRVNVGGPVGQPVAPGFIGFSVEYPSSLAYSGHDPARPNPTYIQLVRNLNPGQAPVIRFGGDTADWTWWPVPGMAKPPGIRYTLGPQWIAVTRATARALGARLILGINFEADSGLVAGTEARALLQGIGRPYVAGFELGNEPEVYGVLGWYRNSAGVEVLGRPRGYGFDAFQSDYASIVGALPGGVPLAGPATGAPAFWSALGRFLTAEPRVRTATVHRYPLNRCFTARSSPLYPTIPNLLAPQSSAGLAQALAGQIATVHQHGATYRVDELNSVACGGASGVSDTFASSLWMLDTLFGLAQVGADGVNIHTFKTGRYAPFTFSRSGGRWHAQVKPEYYGLLMFARAAPPGSRLLTFTGPAVGTLRQWATRAPDGTVRVVLINESPRRAETLAVRAPNSAGTATLTRLTAPGLAAKRGITIGGQRFANASTTGRLTGSAQAQTLSLIQQRFVVKVPRASVALLTIPRS